MKIHRVVTMLGATNETGKLASDMYDLNYKTYYSEAEDRYIPISHMDFQHMVRAFVKLCSEDQDVTIARCDGKDSTIEAQDKIINGLRSQVETLNGIIEEKDETINKLGKEEQRWRKAYANDCYTQGWRYVFSEIPNDEYGKKLTRGMKMYLNDESYTMRVRGQHIKPELRGTGATYWGQSIEESTHLRVYIDKKKGA